MTYKSHGDVGVIKHAGVTDWKHVITNLHMCGRKSFLPSLTEVELGGIFYD